MVDAPTGHVTLGAYMANGIEQKGIDTLQQCIKKCAAAGLGIPATVSTIYQPRLENNRVRPNCFSTNILFNRN